MKRYKSFEPVLEKAMMDNIITVEERIKIKDQIMYAKIISYGLSEPYVTFRDVKYFLGDERFKECIGEETYDKLKQLYITNVDDEADKDNTATAIGDPLIRSIFELIEDAKELRKECEKRINFMEEDK